MNLRSIINSSRYGNFRTSGYSFDELWGVRNSIDDSDPFHAHFFTKSVAKGYREYDLFIHLDDLEFMEDRIEIASSLFKENYDSIEDRNECKNKMTSVIHGRTWLADAFLTFGMREKDSFSIDKAMWHSYRAFAIKHDWYHKIKYSLGSIGHYRGEHKRLCNTFDGARKFAYKQWEDESVFLKLFIFNEELIKRGHSTVRDETRVVNEKYLKQIWELGKLSDYGGCADILRSRGCFP